MGWWGHESDANDNTFNSLGIGIPDRFAGAEVIPDDAAERPGLEKGFAESLQKILSDIESNTAALEDSEYERAAFLGVVRLGLVKRLAFSAAHLTQAKAFAVALLADDTHTGNFRDPELRKRCLRDEMAMIDDALANSGRTDKGVRSQSLGDKMNAHLAEEPNRFRNFYACPCGEEWDDESPATNNDRCPVCNSEIEPYKSEDLPTGLDEGGVEGSEA